MNTPRNLGYRFPAEWEKHEATWLTWPFRDESFPGKLESVYPSYLQFIKQMVVGEKVRINIPDAGYSELIKNLLVKNNINDINVEFYVNQSNDVWCRDHGPAFLIKPGNPKSKAVVNWKFNAWGGKYPYELDNKIAENIASCLGLEIFKPGIIMEGGSVDFNGAETLLTTTSCLLNKNRNPKLSQKQIEQYLCDYYCANQVLWLNDGIAGDDTDGHIDDITRFIDSETVVTMVESNKNDANYVPLKENLKLLKKMRLINGRQINIIELPMPEPVYYDNLRLPASYANFYFANKALIVPTFRCRNDEVVLKLLSEIIKDRPVIGIDSVDIIWGFGSFHCLSQQEPENKASPTPPKEG
jgi:agmatine deiminase